MYKKLLLSTAGVKQIIHIQGEPKTPRIIDALDKKLKIFLFCSDKNLI